MSKEEYTEIHNGIGNITYILKRYVLILSKTANISKDTIYYRAALYTWDGPNQVLLQRQEIHPHNKAALIANTITDYPHVEIYDLTA